MFPPDMALLDYSCIATSGTHKQPPWLMNKFFFGGGGDLLYIVIPFMGIYWVRAFPRNTSRNILMVSLPVYDRWSLQDRRFVQFHYNEAMRGETILLYEVALNAFTNCMGNIGIVCVCF